MPANSECLQLRLGEKVPCRGDAEYYGKELICPFSTCMAAVALSDPDGLLKNVMGGQVNFHASVLVREVIFHMVCPGTFNPDADENKLFNYSPEKPFIESPEWTKQ